MGKWSFQIPVYARKFGKGSGMEKNKQIKKNYFEFLKSVFKLKARHLKLNGGKLSEKHTHIQHTHTHRVML